MKAQLYHFHHHHHLCGSLLLRQRWWKSCEGAAPTLASAVRLVTTDLFHSALDSLQAVHLTDSLHVYQL